MLKKVVDAVELKMISCYNRFTRSERGDTNFISILIILGIVILLAGVFMVFKDQIVGQVQNIVDGFEINPTGGVEPT